MKHYDAIVVGGGPAGITAALYLCRSGISVAQIEMLAPGGQILKTESIENYPGFPKGIKGWEMAYAFAAHLDDYELVRYNDAVLKMEQVPGGWSFSVGKETIVGKAVVVCSGANPRPLGVPRETQLTGRGVSYCALCDGNFFRDQVVAVDEHILAVRVAVGFLRIFPEDARLDRLLLIVFADPGQLEFSFFLHISIS